MPVTTYTNFGGRIVSENRNGVKSDYVADTLGNTAALVNASGITDTWNYWPNGEVAARTGTNPTPFTFVGTLGYRLDALTNLEYVRARHLRPGLARWQTVDPLWPREPSYAYASLAPAVWRDPTGLDDTSVGDWPWPTTGTGSGTIGGAGGIGCAAGGIAVAGALAILSFLVLEASRQRSRTTDTRWRQKFPQFSDCQDLFDSCKAAASHRPNSWQLWQWLKYCDDCLDKCLKGGGLGQALATGCSFWIVIRDRWPTAHDPL